MKTQRRRLSELITHGLLALALTASVFGQGSLTPPAGVPAPTMKSLDQIEPRTPISSLPFTITQPGAYYFTKNLRFSAPTGDAITINSSSVFLDLNGFELSSNATVTGRAIVVANHDVRIANGAINGTTTVSITGSGAARTWTVTPGGFDNGVDAGYVLGAEVSQLKVTGCRHYGVLVNSRGSITKVIAQRNGQDGIGCYGYCLIDECHSFWNGALGIYAYDSNITNCVVTENQLTGIQGSGTISYCTVISNGSHGIDASDGIVTACKATGNGGNGIMAPQGVITACQANGNNIKNNGSVNIVGPTAPVDPFAISTLPFTISQSGSYYLTRNLTFSAASGNAITITTGAVKLDLKGYTLNSSVGVTGNAISLNNVENVSITNGSILGSSTQVIAGAGPGKTWTFTPGGFASGITSVGNTAGGMECSHLSINGCRNYGIILGHQSLIHHVMAMNNGQDGIASADVQSEVDHCISYNNGGLGIYALEGAVSDCTTSNNQSDGIFCTGTVIHCVSKGNGNNGISATQGVVIGCKTINNGTNGIIGTNGVVSTSLASGNNQKANGSLDINAVGATRTGNFPAP